MERRHGASLVCGHIFSVATEALGRAQNMRQALIAVIFSVTTLEAFLNEIGEWVEHRKQLGVASPPLLDALLDVLAECEESHGSLMLKVLLWLGFTGAERADTGRQPLQDL